MLTRQALWVPVTQFSAHFLAHFRSFLTDNPVTSQNIALIKLQPEQIRVLLEPDPRDATRQRQIATHMAFPFTVTADVCEESTSNGAACVDIGFATALCDSCNSLHVMHRIDSGENCHVSVNMQVKSLSPLRVGESAVLISSIEKMGKRLIFCTARIYRDELAKLSAEEQRQEGCIASAEDVKRVLQHYPVTFHSAHVKSMITLPKKEKSNM